MGKVRFEDQVAIRLKCCKQRMKLTGNLSLRGAAGATQTVLAYECTKCFRRVSVTDEWAQPNAAALEAMDSVE